MSVRVNPGGLLAAAWLWPCLAAADPATAEALFRDGRRLLDEGHYPEACEKLAESQNQDPASGTLINLALCYEKQGKLATAWAVYQSAAALARKDGRPDRESTAEQKTAELDGRVPRLILRAKQPAPGLSIRFGDISVGSGALDSPIPVDPAELRFEVTAPGRLLWLSTLTIHEGETRELSIPELARVDAPLAAPPTPIAPSLDPLGGPRVSPISESPAESHALAYVIGGAGVLSLGVGAIFGVTSLSSYRDAERRCPTHQGCDATALDAWHRAGTRAWISDITLGVGVAAVATAAWLLWRKHDRAQTAEIRVLPAPSGASVAVFRAF